MYFLALLLHFVGDYLTQNDFIAKKKTSDIKIALLHGFIYGLPFAVIVGFSWQLAAIMVSHAVIDRWRLATYWIKLVNWNFKSDNFGFSSETPKFMSVWLMIIVDNTIHVSINALCISSYL